MLNLWSKFKENLKMKIKALKKLQLITVLLLILTILLMVIGLLLIKFSNFYDYFKNIWKNGNGFKISNHYGLIYIINHSSNYLCHISNNYENHYHLIKLQVGIIFLCNFSSNFTVYNYVINVFYFLV